VTKVGFTVIIQKQSNNRRSGRAYNRQEQKRHCMSRVQQRASSLFFFFEVKGIVDSDFVPPNTTVKCDFYCDVFRGLRENVLPKRPEIWFNNNWLLHHDNAPAHTSLKTTEFVTNNNMVIIPHSPYLPDLAPVISCCFPKLKMKLKGRRF
jgi:hypothetical protein